MVDPRPVRFRRSSPQLNIDTEIAIGLEAADTVLIVITSCIAVYLVTPFSPGQKDPIPALSGSPRLPCLEIYFSHLGSTECYLVRGYDPPEFRTEH